MPERTVPRYKFKYRIFVGRRKADAVFSPRKRGEANRELLTSPVGFGAASQLDERDNYQLLTKDYTVLSVSAANRLLVS